MTPGLIGLAALGVYAVALVGLRLVRTPSAGLVGVDGGGPVRAQRSLVGALHAALGRRLEPLIRRTMTEGSRRRLEHWLDAAGRPDRWGIADVIRAKGGDTGICVLLGIGAMTLHPLLGPVMVVYGYLRRDLQLRSAARRRQAQIERDLPDYLDILGVTVQAGLKFRGALRRVGEQFDSPVAEEFRIALQQLDVGASRRAAFEGLRDRNDSPSLNRFVGALLQSEELGAPLTDAMASIARDMRKVFSQNVRRDAAKAAPKVTLVATVLLMPGAALLLIGGLLIGGDIQLGGLFGG
ncbi:type II secretion system F family protein [Euzebya sp.]|uniref:type II secretion system F family protein n=1 Tax=Euzebya sp. TaxID=1971409 RepID=UPI003513EB52